MAEEKETYQVTMLMVPKITNDTIKQCIELAKADIKPYVVEIGDRVPFMTSNIDENLMDAIDVLNKKGIKVAIIGGAPTPPPCPPRGCSDNG